MRAKQQLFINRELDINKIRADFEKIRIRLEQDHCIS